MATYTSKARLPSQGKTVCDFRPLTLGSMQIFGTREPMVPKIGIHFNTRNPVCSYCPARETNWHTNVLNIFFCSLDMLLQKTYKAWPPNSTFLGVKIDIQNLWYPIFGTRGKYGVNIVEIITSFDFRKNPALICALEVCQFLEQSSRVLNRFDFYEC